MTDLSLNDVKATISAGLLTFPVTHFDDELEFDETAYRAHLAWLAGFDAVAVFAAGGTGEFFSLTPAEVQQVVATAVSERVTGRPVVAPVGYGTAIAVEMARSAEELGADAILLLPPYLTELSQEGLRDHVRAVCRATKLGVIVYHRANALYSATTIAELADELPNLIGFKDGLGDFDTLAQLTSTLGDRLVYVGGVPTAEGLALPYLAAGVTTYSSAIYNYLPKWANAFYGAARAGDRVKVEHFNASFLNDYIDLRKRKAGYAVSIVKAGLQVTGRAAGRVRPPLSELTKTDQDDLAELVTRAQASLDV